MTDALRLAFGTLTAIPVAAPTRIDRPVARAAMLLGPVAAVPFAVAVVLAHLAVAWAGLDQLVAAGLLLAVLALGTRGLHLDGLADTCDGLAAAYERARALAVMRAGDVGPAGVGAVVLVLVVDAAALGVLLRTAGGAALASVAVLASRHTLAWLCRPGLHAARPDGLGATVAGSVPVSASLVVGGGLAALALEAAVLAGLPWYAGPLTVVAAVAAAWALGRRASTRFGGITGDVLGAGVEVGLAAALVVASALV